MCSEPGLSDTTLEMGVVETGKPADDPRALAEIHSPECGNSGWSQRCYHNVMQGLIDYWHSTHADIASHPAFPAYLKHCERALSTFGNDAQSWLVLESHFMKWLRVVKDACELPYFSLTCPHA